MRDGVDPRFEKFGLSLDPKILEKAKQTAKEPLALLEEESFGSCLAASIGELTIWRHLKQTYGREFM